MSSPTRCANYGQCRLRCAIDAPAKARAAVAEVSRHRQLHLVAGPGGIDESGGLWARVKPRCARPAGRHYLALGIVDGAHLGGEAGAAASGSSAAGEAAQETDATSSAEMHAEEGGTVVDVFSGGLVLLCRARYPTSAALTIGTRPAGLGGDFSHCSRACPGLQRLRQHGLLVLPALDQQGALQA